VRHCPRWSVLVVVLFTCGAAAYRFTSDAQDESRALAERDEDLDRMKEACAVRHRERSLLCDDLVAGRRTVGEVVDEFARLNRQLPECAATLAAVMPNLTERERTERQVVEWLTIYLRDRPDLTPGHRASLLEGIEAQLLEPAE
jgi:hypothetical protein